MFGRDVNIYHSKICGKKTTFTKQNTFLLPKSLIVNWFVVCRLDSLFSLAPQGQEV
jgi:hypothetical protein